MKLKLVFSAAAQFGIFGAFAISLAFGFDAAQAGVIGSAVAAGMLLGFLG